GRALHRRTARGRHRQHRRLHPPLPARGQGSAAAVPPCRTRQRPRGAAMNAAVSALRPAPANAATQPALSDPLRATVGAKSAASPALLREAVAEFGAHGELAFANSFGAEDMVLTDLILSHALPITVFSLDTGRLPAETYTLIGEVERRYDTKLEIYFPDAGAVETFVRSHGINAFYDSVELRKACCGVRKMEPLRRALAGRKAWITGLRAAQSVT